MSSAAAQVTIAISADNGAPLAYWNAASNVAWTSLNLTLTGDDADANLSRVFSFEIVVDPARGRIGSFDPATGLVQSTPDAATTEWTRSGSCWWRTNRKRASVDFRATLVSSR